MSVVLIEIKMNPSLRFQVYEGPGRDTGSGAVLSLSSRWEWTRAQTPS